MSSSAVPPCSLSTAIHPLLQREFILCSKALLNGVLKADSLLASGGVTAHSMVQILMAILHEACMIMFVGECFDFSCKSHKISREDGKPYQELLLWSQGE